MASTYLIPQLSENYPHYSESLDNLLKYTKFLLVVSGYAPGIRPRILSIIVHGLVQLDLAIQTEIEDLDDDEVDEIKDAVFSMDDFVNLEHPQSDEVHRLNSSDSELDSASEDSDDNSSVGSMHGIKTDFKKLFVKLDSLMTTMFHYIKSLDKAPTKKYNLTKRHIEIQEDEEESELESVFFNLLDIFVEIVLPTHRIKCVQFLVFYASSLDDSFPEAFMGLLVQQLISDKTSSSITRVSCTSVKTLINI